MKSPSRFARLMLAAVGLCAGILTLEVGLRCRTAYDRYRVKKAALTRPTGKVEAGQIVQFNDNPRLVYDLRPNLDVEFKGVRVKTNAEGFRDSDHPVEKPPGKRRIVLLGDSNLFAWGVPYESGCVRVAARDLPDWDLLNLARPGYNSAQEVECFKVYGMKYQPDVVMINFISNDDQLPNYIQRSPGDLSASFLVDWLDGRLDPAGLAAARPVQRENRRQLEDNPQRVPAAYQSLVGWEAVRRAYLELGRLAREQNFVPVVLCFPHLDERGVRYAREAGFQICDFTPHWIALRDNPNLQGKIFVSPTDSHPAALAHEAFGHFLADWVKHHLRFDL